MILSQLRSKRASEVPKGPIANGGCKRYLTAKRESIGIDDAKTQADEMFEGIWVLRTNAGRSAVDTA